MYQSEDQECLFCLSDLGSFFKDFQTVVASFQIKRDHIAITCSSKISVKAIGSSVEAQYSRLLTPYAAKLVREQLEKVEKVQFIDEESRILKLHQSSALVIFIRI